MPSSNSEVPVTRKTHPINESTTNFVLPQGGKQSQTVSYNQDTRHQDVHPTPLQGREKGGNIEDQGNPGQGPCFNCKEYGHYSRDCPEVCGTQDTFIKKRYYSPQQEDILSRSSKTEAYPRHHYPPLETRTIWNTPIYPLKDLAENTNIRSVEKMMTKKVIPYQILKKIPSLVVKIWYQGNIIIPSE